MSAAEPNLARRIEQLIDQTPIVDPHTHIRCDQPTAPDLASLMSYHWVQTELRAVGMSPADLDTALPPNERVRRAIPYLRKMRNTAMAWCFYRILADLYDFHEPHITEANYEALCAKVEATGRDATWFPRVLDRCNIKTVVTSLGNKSQQASKNPDNFYYMLDAHYLFCPGVATDLQPFFDGRTTKQEYYAALTQLFGGERPNSSARLEQLLNDWLSRTVTDRVRFTNTYIPVEQRFLPPDRARVDAILNRAAVGEAMTDVEIDAVVQFVTWTVLGWHNDHRKAFQIAVGAEYFICDGKSIPRFQQNWTSEMARAFHQFPQVRFDLMMASDVLTHETCVLARQFPNVYTSGYWWHNFFPGLIEKIVGLRLQIVPMVKFSGFLCDAYYVEWSYGKLQVIKKAMAAALSHLVEMGYYREDDLPVLLHQMLHDSPRDLYDLGPR